MKARTLPRRPGARRLLPEMPDLAPVLRQLERFAAIVDALVELLDALDGDPDTEPDHYGEADAEGEDSATVPAGVGTWAATCR